MHLSSISGGARMEQPSSGYSSRLVLAAHEFEAEIMKELLKPMTAGDALTGEDDSGSGGALTEFASEALGRALSDQGGFGIADRIVKSLSQAGAMEKSGQGTRNLHGKIVLKSPR